MGLPRPPFQFSLRRPILGARNARCLFILVSALTLTYTLWPFLIAFASFTIQTSPFSGQSLIEQPFTPTDAELNCLEGLTPAGQHIHPDQPEADPIPNVVHFIFGLKNPLTSPSAGEFSFLNYLAIRSALLSLQPTAIHLHYTYLSSPPSPSPDANPLTNPWIRRLRPHIHLVHHPPPSLSSSTHYAHLSDTLRLEILLSQGGIYLDTDVLALRPFSRLLATPSPYDTVLGHEGGSRWGLCNAVIVARPNSTFVARWLASYADDDVDLEAEAWNARSVRLPKRLADEHPGEVCALAPDAFFWPTWTWRHVAWMHEELAGPEAEVWKEEVRRHGGGLWSGQRAYHAWGQMAGKRFLDGLTPAKVRGVDTRFNILARRFLEDDLE